MHTVTLVVFDRISPFEMAVPCEVFGTDRSDMGLPNYRFLVCAAEEGLLRTDAGFGIVRLAGSMGCVRPKPWWCLRGATWGACVARPG